MQVDTGRNKARRRGLPAAMCAMLAVNGCGGAPLQCRGELVAVLPLTQGFTIGATVNGRPAKLLLDTGSTENILTTSAVTRLSLHTSALLDDVDVPHGFALQGVGGRRHYDRVEVASFKAGGLSRQGVQFASLWSGYAPWDVDGVLGMRTLGDYNIDIDAAARRVTLYEPGSPCTEAAARYSRVLLAHNGAVGPLVAVQLDGKWLTAILDTGAERSILYAPLMTGGELTANGIGPEQVHAKFLPPERLQIGDIDLADLQVIGVQQARPGPADLVLGMDFFRRVHVLLAPASGTAWLQTAPLG